MTVYLVIEEEPETSTGFPSVVIGVFASLAGAEALVRDKEAGYADYGAEEADITWGVEEHEVQK